MFQDVGNNDDFISNFKIIELGPITRQMFDYDLPSHLLFSAIDLVNSVCSQPKVDGNAAGELHQSPGVYP